MRVLPGAKKNPQANIRLKIYHLLSALRLLGLLTLGSSYTPRLPIRLKTESGLLRCSSPITAAGPYRNLTGFPFIASGASSRMPYHPSLELYLYKRRLIVKPFRKE